MKRYAGVLPWTMLALVLAGCSSDASPPDSRAVPPRAESRPGNSTRPALDRLSLVRATVVVRTEVFRSKPGMNPSASFPLRELTTTEVWDRLHVQVFMVTEGVNQGQAYLVRDQHASPLGRSFGGHGVMSMCVIDPAGDGQPQLLFSYSFGSGAHRSLVGVWSGGTAWVDARPALGDYDLALEKVDDRNVGVSYGKFDPVSRHFNRHGEFGTVRLVADGASPAIEIALNEKLPPDVRDKIRK